MILFKCKLINVESERFYAASSMNALMQEIPAVYGVEIVDESLTIINKVTGSVEDTIDHYCAVNHLDVNEITSKCKRAGLVGARTGLAYILSKDCGMKAPAIGDILDKSPSSIGAYLYHAKEQMEKGSGTAHYFITRYRTVEAR